MTTTRLESDDLVGVGLYSPADAARLLKIAPRRLTRWVQGHVARGTRYEPLWSPQIDLGEDGVYLGFRDLQEARVAVAFLERGLSPQRVRRVIAMARELADDPRPLATKRFRTDGRAVFLEIVDDEGEASLLDLFKGQFAFREILERSLTNIDYDEEGLPVRWWPMGKAARIVIDPSRSFGQPIEAESSVPVAALVAANAAEGSVESAARTWRVPPRAIKRALAFETHFLARRAA